MSKRQLGNVESREEEENSGGFRARQIVFKFPFCPLQALLRWRGHWVSSALPSPLSLLPFPCLLFWFVFLFWNVILCSLQWLQTHSVAKSGLGFLNLLLHLLKGATTPGSEFPFLYVYRGYNVNFPCCCEKETRCLFEAFSTVSSTQPVVQCERLHSL